MCVETTVNVGIIQIIQELGGGSSSSLAPTTPIFELGLHFDPSDSLVKIHDRRTDKVTTTPAELETMGWIWSGLQWLARDVKWGTSVLCPSPYPHLPAPSHRWPPSSNSAFISSNWTAHLKVFLLYPTRLWRYLTDTRIASAFFSVILLKNRQTN